MYLDFVSLKQGCCLLWVLYLGGYSKFAQGYLEVTFLCLHVSVGRAVRHRGGAAPRLPHHQEGGQEGRRALPPAARERTRQRLSCDKDPDQRSVSARVRPFCATKEWCNHTPRFYQIGALFDQNANIETRDACFMWVSVLVCVCVNKSTFFC